MIFRQLFDHESYSFSYLIACEKSREALIIDPVANQVTLIQNYVKELGLVLKKTIETHVHADHITGANMLKKNLDTESYSAIQANVSCASQNFIDQDLISVGELDIKALYTPGHTDDSYCFLLERHNQNYLFTGDTLLIRGTGRTDFQNGSAKDLYRSLQGLLTLPETSLVFPGHDYHGRNLSTIAEEKNYNPRLINQTECSFITMMETLNLPKPKLLDIAVPANQACGKLALNQKMEAE